VVAAPFMPEFLPVAITAALVLLAIDWRLWRYFVAERDWWFALRAVPIQWLYYLYSGAAFAWVVLTGDWRRQRAARMQEPA